MTVNKNPAKDFYGNPVGRGRPNNNDTYKPFMVHDLNRIKEKNLLAYTEETVRNAKSLYRRYNLPHPNPLNIDVKDLDSNAKTCWEYIFSTRNYDGSEAETGNAHEKIFYTPDEAIFAFECYVEHIKNSNFVREFTRPDGNIGIIPIVPNQTNFARWLGIRHNVVYDAVSASEEARRKYMTLLADCLSEGAMAGVYQAGSTQFALKNMCDWADKYEDKSYKRDTTLAVEEANSLMQSLGYTREKAKLEAPKPLLESDTNG